MNIRFVILLMTIFMVFVPCYGMQVANLADYQNSYEKIREVSKTKLTGAELAFLIAIGFGIYSLIKAIKNKVNKKRIWGTIVAILGWIILAYSPLPFMVIIASLFFSPTPSAAFNLLMVGATIAMIILGIWIIRKGRKMRNKGKQEEQDKLKNN